MNVKFSSVYIGKLQCFWSSGLIIVTSVIIFQLFFYRNIKN